LWFISACNEKNNKSEHFSNLKKCTVLGDESIIYARAHYVKIFHRYNPKKFSDSFKQIADFDAVTHRNTIESYLPAVNKINPDRPVTKDLLAACKKLAVFTRDFVDESFPIAMMHRSKADPLSDAFFIEINNIVKFDDKIGAFNKNIKSFKQIVTDYEKAVIDYIAFYRDSIPESFIKQRLKEEPK